MDLHGRCGFVANSWQSDFLFSDGQRSPLSQGAEHCDGVAHDLEYAVFTSLYLKELALGFIAWVVILGLIQDGLTQIHQAQQEYLALKSPEYPHAPTAGPEDNLPPQNSPDDTLRPAIV